MQRTDHSPLPPAAALPAATGCTSADDPACFTAFLRRHSRIAVLSGAGLSTGSGIPDYRDAAGNWKHARPVQFADFRASHPVRQRYWAGSLRGWQRIARARPNAAHLAITRLERSGRVTGIITQNVDNLHRRAGSRNIIDLHGTLEDVRCLQCSATMPRAGLQSILEQLNPGWEGCRPRYAPDGDSALDAATDTFIVPDCSLCGGLLKPNVVFFGEAVPEARVARARDLLRGSDALLVVGSSLMVFSGYRFVRLAAACGIPIAIVNLGLTRADSLATWLFPADCTTLLPDCIAALCNA